LTRRASGQTLCAPATKRAPSCFARTVARSVLPLAAHAQELRFDVIQESLPIKPGDIVSAE